MIKYLSLVFLFLTNCGKEVYSEDTFPPIKLNHQEKKHGTRTHRTHKKTCRDFDRKRGETSKNDGNQERTDIHAICERAIPR